MNGRGIPVCLRCLGSHIRPQSMREGLWAGGGEGVAWVCDGCGHIGAPLLVDTPAAGGQAAFDDERAWQNEVRDAAFQVEDDDWHRRPASLPRRGFGAVLAGLGALFLVPVPFALGAALASGRTMAFLDGLGATVWLLAIGVALLGVGVQMLRAPATPSDPVSGRDTY